MVLTTRNGKDWLSHVLRDHFIKNRSLSYRVAYLVTIALFLSLWHSRITREVSLRAFAIFVVLGGLCFIYGRLFMTLVPSFAKTKGAFSIQFLCGYLLLNALLLVLSIVTPFGIVTNSLILGGAGLLSLLFCRGAVDFAREPADYLPDFLCLLLSGVAATLWCTDLLSGVMTDGQNMIYPIYVDGFYHVRQISSFAQAHGLKTMSDIHMSGHAPRLYHYAIYVGPAALSFFTNSSAYTMFVSFLVPFGIFLTGLAAFSLAGSVWGAWPGLAATLAVSLLPDAYQQGFENKWLSYNFFQQVAPGGSYGVACVAIAWSFVLDGCKRGKLSSVIMGYVALLMCINYKAQFFVANAFLIMVYPCVFFPGLRMSWRVISAVTGAGLFYLVASLSQHVEGIPTLRFNGSGAMPYAHFLFAASDPGALTSFFRRTFVVLSESKAYVFLYLYLAGYLVLSTFGLWAAALVLISFLGKMRIGVAAFLFPFLIVGNYVVMSLGLATDTMGIGLPDELLHRPFVWAYFVIVTWVGAGTYVCLVGNRGPRSTSARIFAVLFAVCSFSVPLVCARDIQTFPAARQLASYRMFNSVPSDLSKACLYIRKHSETNDIIQDSENDPRWVIAALAERQDFAADSRSFVKIRLPKGLLERLHELEKAKQISDEPTLREFMHTRLISWYILRPESKVAWPSSVLNTPLFRAGDYRVYHFIP